MVQSMGASLSSAFPTLQRSTFELPFEMCTMRRAESVVVVETSVSVSPDVIAPVSLWNSVVLGRPLSD